MEKWAKLWKTAGWLLGYLGSLSQKKVQVSCWKCSCGCSPPLLKNQERSKGVDYFPQGLELRKYVQVSVPVKSEYFNTYGQMDYFSLCRKACLVKDFLKSIHWSNPVTVVEVSILTPKTHDTVKCRSILLEGKLLFLLSPYPSFSKSFKWIPLDSKWCPDFAEVIFFVYLYVWLFFPYLLWAIRTLGFLRCTCMVWNVKCMALPYSWSYS